MKSNIIANRFKKISPPQITPVNKWDEVKKENSYSSSKIWLLDIKNLPRLCSKYQYASAPQGGVSRKPNVSPPAVTWTKPTWIKH